MAFLPSLDIAGSGMTAQKRRLDVIAENIVNRETLRTEEGGPYRRKLTVFREIPHQSGSGSFSSTLRRARSSQDASAKGGVMVSEIIEDDAPLVPVYDPTHPDADEEGYVMMPNVDTTVEMIDAMAATRSFSANAQAFEAIKQMAQYAMNIGK